MEQEEKYIVMEVMESSIVMEDYFNSVRNTEYLVWPVQRLTGI